MSLSLVLWIIAAILFALEAFGLESRVNLFYLGWSFAAIAYAFG